MKRIKRILAILVLLASLVPMVAFGTEGKFLGYYQDKDSYAHIGLTNYKGKVAGFPEKIALLHWDEDGDNDKFYGGYLDGRYKGNHECHDTAVTTGKTTVTVGYGKNVDGYFMRVMPVLFKAKNNIFFTGKQQEFHEGYEGKQVKAFSVLEPGEYFISFNPRTATDSKNLGYLKIEGGEPTPIVDKLPTNEKVAKPTSSKVLVDNKSVDFEAYNIEGSNYFKLRDFAYAVIGTPKQFQVDWDAEKGAIDLISNSPYTPEGNELVRGNGKEKSSVISKAKIYQDGKEISLEAYTIDGNNYFKLRDLADTFGIIVTWDKVTSTIGIETSKL